MRIAIIGAGRMGRAVAALARARGHVIAAELDRGEVRAGALADAQVAIEFTEPGAAPANLRALAEWRMPTVCGTTGWHDRLPEITTAVERSGTALVHSPNFSTGVLLLTRLARAAGELLARRPEFATYLLEVHHAHKQDAPSGTARLLRDALRAGDPARDYPVTSVRAGSVPGVHEIHLEAEGEGITLAHVARDRSVFAAGALMAAQWLLDGPRRGVYTFEHVLFGRQDG
jgi:4-hydroxy-tetrahydrodipicolinate reductase